MEATTIHPAGAYLRNADNPPYLYVWIEGTRPTVRTGRR